MDEEEAKTMVKGLRQAGLDAEREQRQREREAKAARAKASTKALVAMTKMEPMPHELQPAARPAMQNKPDLGMLGVASPTSVTSEVGGDYDC